MTRYSERGTLLPTDLAALRFAGAGLIMAPWLWRVRHRLPSLPRMLLLALCGGIGYALLAYHAFALAPAAHGAVLLPGMMPFLVALVAMVVLGERPSPGRALGLAIIAGGMVCVAVEGIAPGLGDGTVWRGDALFVAASLCWSVFTVLLRRWAVAPWDAVGITACFSALIYLPVHALLLPSAIADAPLSEVLLQGGYLGFLAVIVALALFARAVAGLGPTRMGVLMALVPASGALLAVPVLGEPLTPLTIAGVVFASGGAVIAARAQALSSRR